MFAPNASFRVGVNTDHRDTVEADFLVWRNLGVLDVDGPGTQTGPRKTMSGTSASANTAPAWWSGTPPKLCYSTPDDWQFLRLLERNGWPLSSEVS
jgi:hypothetical protein